MALPEMRAIAEERRAQVPRHARRHRAPHRQRSPSASPASPSRRPRRTAPTRSTPANSRSTSSKRACRFGRRSTTSTATPSGARTRAGGREGRTRACCAVARRHGRRARLRPRRPRGVAIAVGHGYSSSKHNLDLLCAFLASHGFHVVERRFSRPQARRERRRAAFGRRSRSTTLGAARRLSARAYTRLVYAMGHSMGATTALARRGRIPRSPGPSPSRPATAGRPRSTRSSRGGIVDLRSGLRRRVGAAGARRRRRTPRPRRRVAAPGRPAGVVRRRRARRDGDARERRGLFARAPEPKSFASSSSDHTYAGENARAAVLAWLNERHPRARSPNRFRRRARRCEPRATRRVAPL